MVSGSWGSGRGRFDLIQSSLGLISILGPVQLLTIQMQRPALRSTKAYE